jgi:hypothetical protein
MSAGNFDSLSGLDQFPAVLPLADARDIPD